jgi:hypothetical protein
MSDTPFSTWLRSKTTLPGLLGLGIYAPGKPTLVQTCSSGVSEPALENAWRCVAETIPVLQINQFPTAGFRFVFGKAFVHCERRPDGTCVGVCASRDDKVFPPDELERLLAEFHAL